MAYQLFTGDTSMKMSEQQYNALGPQGQQFFLTRARQVFISAAFDRDVLFATHQQTKTIFLGPLHTIIAEANRMNLVVHLSHNNLSLPQLVPASSLGNLANIAAFPLPNDSRGSQEAALPSQPQPQRPQHQAQQRRVGQSDDSGEHSHSGNNNADHDMIRAPRSPNAFFLFKNWIENTQAKGKGDTTKAKSTAADWIALDPSQRKPWFDLAAEDAAVHRKLFPSYKFHLKNTADSTKAGSNMVPIQVYEEYNNWRQAHRCPPGVTQEIIAQIVKETHQREASQQKTTTKPVSYNLAPAHQVPSSAASTRVSHSYMAHHCPHHHTQTHQKGHSSSIANDDDEGEGINTPTSRCLVVPVFIQGPINQRGNTQGSSYQVELQEDEASQDITPSGQNSHGRTYDSKGPDSDHHDD
ncbi:hypothetical protein F5Y16DRAFT_398819 [Xylariaceae sp. FL0255]|nr:hypothetical protein F5Y16DRAFT_398819 [Xylariaceae sp. FL0255]